MKPLDLKKWPIFNMLLPGFTSQIHMIMNFEVGTEEDGDAALIVTRDKMVYGLGINYKGRLGIGFMSRTLYPRMVEILCQKNIKTFVYGTGPRVFALTEEGKVYSWGSNTDHGLGHGSRTPIPEIVHVPTAIASLNGKCIVNIACGKDYCLALDDDGNVYTWGKHVINPSLVFTNKKIISIACGLTFNIAVTDQNKVYSWGKNCDDHVLGYSSDTCSSYNSYSYHSSHEDNKLPTNNPREITSLSQKRIVKVVSGCNHTLALNDKGELYTWGINSYGQLGTNSTTSRNKPTVLNVPIMGKVSDIAAMHDKDVSVAIGEDGRIYVWGYCFGQNITTPLATQFSNMHDVFVNNVLHVIHEPLIVSTDDRKYENEETNIYKCLETAFNDSSTSDLIVQVEGQCIHVHKTILKITCQYFRTMFQYNWVENNENVIKHDQFSYIVYKAFLKYLYTGVIDLSLEDYANVLELIKLADTYNETYLKRDCIHMLKDGITESTAALFYKTAVECNAKELEEFCFQFICNHLTAVVQTENFNKWNENTKTTFIIKAAKEGAFKM